MSRLTRSDTEADNTVRRILDERRPAVFTMIAGAGSGKTTSLVKALDHVIKTRGPEMRARGQKVACITYTEIAADEIADELRRDRAIHVSTIHSFLWSVIKPFQQDVRAWVQQRAEERLAELEDEASRARSRHDELAARVERRRAELPSISAIQSFDYHVAPRYGEGIVGHDDIIRMVPPLIEERPLLAKLLARRFPVVLVDESQDTLASVVTGLLHVASTQEPFQLGFFGDPMQKIYVQGAGSIELQEGLQRVPKPENYRSPRRVLEVINAIRAEAPNDNLQQQTGLKPTEWRDGNVAYFVFPADDERRLPLLDRALDHLAEQSKSGGWRHVDGSEDAKVLVITHRMAARRLHFEELFDMFRNSHRLSDAFDEGRAWPLTPFIETLVPIVEADNNSGLVMSLLRDSSPLLQPETLTAEMTRPTLDRLAKAVKELRDIFEKGGPGSIGKAIQLAADDGLITVDDRLAAFLSGDASDDDPDLRDRFLDGDLLELFGYQRYLATDSPYATQQGVKGAEFPRVLVVLDDDEGKHRQFSYDRLFGIRPPSPAEKKSTAEGKESVVDRTRRLLYVCASRATEELAIALYARDVPKALEALRTSGLPGTDATITAEDLTLTTGS
ncbi:DNA helicase-2/ATP-dependent DNA helicase PcrA [Kribbella sp. VKM Ac-2569]|uniref:UvrD-helicase domain-containing protein n=1 Tax=Kribbella sp. VKM Ac-2569 TaxID=2512220 RepID=UPI0010D5F2B7|nr:UvrD-helicase domain-containing protein [Kribbella sp. VKM Ac-2569]RZT07926.1 DNA helicase-2/ATP-dependent DNA helicase PcrA [Kribbella sp. VKM Ac-2569]